VNTNSIPSLSAHRYADNYQNISANLSLPSLSTHTNVPTHVNVPLSQAIALGQSNVTDVPNLYAASYASDLNSSGIVAFPPTVYTSYADNSQRLPIVVEQPGFSTFSRVDVHHSRPAVADSAHTAPLQSPSVHWRKRLAYDYIQPDTGLGAPIHAAPAVHSGYIRPQTSDTHTHSSSVHLQTVSFGEGHTMTSVGPPQPLPPPSSYVPHGHMMPLQVPTVPSVVPPPSHLSFQVPISSSSETSVTYLHVPQTTISVTCSLRPSV